MAAVLGDYEMDYTVALRHIESIVKGNSRDALKLVVDFLYDLFSKYSWVGIYLVQNNELVLGPWKGPHATDHVRITIGDGICGAAAASGRTEIVDDVHADQRYLSCFFSTKSEIVVPIKKGDIVVGEIDIDSDIFGAFNQQDADFLEKVAVSLSRTV